MLNKDLVRCPKWKECPDKPCDHAKPHILSELCGVHDNCSSFEFVPACEPVEDEAVRICSEDGTSGVATGANVPQLLPTDDLLTEEEVRTNLSRHNINEPLFSHRYCYRAGYEDVSKILEAQYQQKIKEIGETLCNYIGTRMQEDMEAGKKLGNDLNPLLKHLRKLSGQALKKELGENW